MFGLIGIVVALALFLYLVYKGWSSYWVAPVCAVIVAVTNVLSPATAIESYVTGLTDMIVNLFSIIFFGAILGKLYGESGAAASIATTLTKKFVLKSEGEKQVRLGLFVVLVVSALCTMGGIDGYVLTFTMVPICFVICEMLDIPRRFIGGMMCLNCAFMAAPGAPQIDNVMARNAIMSEAFKEGGAFVDTAAAMNFNVSSVAAPIPGLVATLFIVVAGYLTLCNFVIKAKRKGEHFEWGHIRKTEINEENLPKFVLALLPLITVFICYTLIPAIFGITMEITFALGAGIIVGLIVFHKNIPPAKNHDGTQSDHIRDRIVKVLNDGAALFPSALITVSTPAALAGVITTTAAFGMVIGILTGFQVNPAILALIVVCILVGITSSPPAALMIALPIIMNIMLGQGFSPAEVLERTPGLLRIGALAATTFETLPVNGLIILTLHLIGCNHKEAYKPMFLQTVVFTLIGSIIATVMIVLFPSLGMM